MTAEIDLLTSGYTAMAEARPADALRIFELLRDLNPTDSIYHYKAAMARLYIDHRRGLEEMSYRRPSGTDNPVERWMWWRGVERWRGEIGKQLAVFHEWGLGDTIMVLRYLPFLTCDVTLMVPPPLVRLCTQLDCKVDDHVPNAHFDYYCPAMSLPLILDEIPPAPYLVVDEILKRKWQLGNGKHMGIVWTGSPTHERDRVRSIALDQFLKLIPSGYELHSLQPAGNDEARAAGIMVHDFADFADVAALMSNMDQVICVDTAAANLAGAIGHPNAHVYLDYAPDWRWYRADEWYPTLKLHRQTRRGDWESMDDRL
jgi:hypothetical protein